MTAIPLVTRLAVVKHLASEKDPAEVATITLLTRRQVIDIGSEHGFPKVASLKRAATMLEDRIAREERDAAITPGRPSAAQPNRPAAEGPPTPPNDAPASTSRPPEPDLKEITKAGTIADPFPRVDDEQTARLRNLINKAKGIPAKRIQRQLERALDALTTLAQLVEEDERVNAEKRRQAEERATAKAEVDRLAAALAEARQKLHGTPGATTADSRAPAATVRAWASENGHDVPARGKLPAAIRAAYDAAHPDAGNTADTTEGD